MPEKEPKIKIHSDIAIKLAKAELQKFGISPIDENIDTYFLLKETSQRPEEYEKIYDNIDNPEKLKKEMIETNLTSLIHIEGPNVRDHTKLGFEILEQEIKEKKIEEDIDIDLIKLIRLYHDLGKHEAFTNPENTKATINTITKGKLFQTMQGHAEEKLETTEKNLKKQLSETDIEFCLKIIKNHMATEILDRKNPEKVLAFFQQFGKQEEEIKKAIKYLTYILYIDFLATENIRLHKDGKLEYFKNNQKSAFTFDAVRNKYQQAKQEVETIQKENETYQEKIDNCQKYLPQIAAAIIPDISANENFRKNPDDPKEHTTMRHQFGIITHTQKSIQHLQDRKKQIRIKKEFIRKIEAQLTEEIDGKPKRELLAIALEFHDIGKFMRTISVEQGKKENIDPFKGHEKVSKDLILHNPIVQRIIQENYQLTDNQLTYIAECVGLHYELSKIRDKAKASPEGFTLDFLQSEKFKQVCMEIKNNNPEFAMEIGLISLCDCLARTDMMIYGKTEEEIDSKIEESKGWIKEKKLPPELIGAVRQRHVNTSSARNYLYHILS